jgi:septin family protein
VQRLRRSQRKPFGFNIMVVGKRGGWISYGGNGEMFKGLLTLWISFLGESGLGKTTFMNTLFNSPLTEKIEAKHLADTKTVSIQPRTFGNKLYNKGF